MPLLAPATPTQPTAPDPVAVLVAQLRAMQAGQDPDVWRAALAAIEQGG